MLSRMKFGYLIKIPILLLSLFISLNPPSSIVHSQTVECDAALENNASAAIPYALQGVFAAFMGDNTDAINFYTQAIESGFNQALIYYLRGNVYAQAAQGKNAEDDFTCAITLAPEAVELYLSRGQIYQNYRDFTRARIDFEQAVDLDPTNWRGYFGRGLTNIMSSADWGSGLTDINRAIDLNPTNGGPFYARGSYYYSNGEYEIAVKEYTQAILLSSGQQLAQSFVWRGFAYSALDDPENAENDFNRAVELEPDNRDYRVSLAQILAYQEDYEAALDQMDSVIDLDPTWADGYRIRSDIYVYQEEFNLAIGAMGFAILLDPSNADFYLYRAQLRRHEEDYRLAISDIETALSLQRTSVGLNLRGDSFYWLNEYEAAIESYTEAIDLEPNNVNAYLARAVNYMQLHDLETAMSDFQTALTMDTGNTTDYLFQASMYIVTADYETAIALLDRVLSAEPENSHAYYLRSSAFARSGEAAQANSDLDTLFEVSALNIEDKYSYRAYNYYNQGAYDLALFAANKVLHVDEDNSQYLAFRGNIYQKLGDEDQASADFELALSYDDDNFSALRGLGDQAFNRLDYETALSYYLQAKNYSSTDFSYYARLGEIYDALGQDDEARFAYELYLKLFGENADQAIIENAVELGVTPPR